MVAFNFTVFLDQIKSGKKTRTIRKSARAKKGDKIQLYTGMRTKDCRKLVCQDATLLDVTKVRISESGVIAFGGEIRGLDDFAIYDGFNNWSEMKSFFRDTYGLPFTGFMHRWHWPENTEHPTKPLAACKPM